MASNASGNNRSGSYNNAGVHGSNDSRKARNAAVGDPYKKMIVPSLY